MLKDIIILREHGIQYLKDLRKANVNQLFRGRPVIRKGISSPCAEMVKHICPSLAIETNPLRIDLGKCLFCRECQFICPDFIEFTNDYRIAANKRENLIITEGDQKEIRLDENQIRPEVRKLFRSALKLRQVSAGGDNSCEMELNAAGNVNFDMGRYGIQFVASPRHADGIVITGPITKNMSEALHITWEAIPEPKIVIIAGTDAISGGMFQESEALDRSFLQQYSVDLYIPGNPCHPLTFINGLLDLIGK